MKQVWIKLGKDREQYTLPNGVVLKEGAVELVDYTPIVSRAVRFGDLIKTTKPKPAPKKKTATKKETK